MQRSFFRFLRWIIICFSFFLSACTKSDRWIDEAQLQDGQAIDVERTVLFHRGKGELSQSFTAWPDQYSFSTVNPHTGKSIQWAGEPDTNPILLDFWETVPYLVVVASRHLDRYGCPEIPYLFFKYDESARRWSNIAVAEFPPVLLHANLSPVYDGYYVKMSRRQRKESIQSRYQRDDKEFIARNIPIDFSSWKYSNKNQYRVEHYQDGCRSKVPSNVDPSHPQSPGMPSQQIDIEVLESKAYRPDWVIAQEAETPTRSWSDYVGDTESNALCNTLTRRVGDESDKPELRGWLLFSKDPTGRNKAQQRGPMLCKQNGIWFFDYVVEGGRVVLSKFTESGEFVYRISFRKPSGTDSVGSIPEPTFKSDDGYLTFEWWNFVQKGSEWHVKRSMKLRLREPDSAPINTDAIARPEVESKSQ